MVTSQGDEVFFKIKTNTKLTKLRTAYAQKVGKDLSTIRSVVVITCSFCYYSNFRGYIILVKEVLTGFYRFLYDGNRISDEDTPALLGMEDNDTIDVMVERTLHLTHSNQALLTYFCLQRSAATGNFPNRKL